MRMLNFPGVSDTCFILLERLTLANILTSRPHKHLDTNLYPPQQGYQAPPPIMGGALTPGPPQYAQFEVGRNGLAVDPKSSTLNEDALPPMPSWETATKKHVLTEEEKNAVELGELDPATGQKFPLMAGAAGTGISQPPSPAHDLSASPYGPRPGQGQGGNGYTEVWGDQYAQQNQSAYEQNGREYRGYDQGPAMGGRGYGQISPTEMDSGVGQGYETASPQDHYGNDNGYFGTANGEGYSRPPPQHQYSNNNDRNYPPQPIRQYSEDSSHQLVPSRQLDRSYQNDRYQSNGSPRGISGPGRMASPPMNNNSGFGFGTGAPQQQYLSRPSPPPQQMSYDSAYSGNTAPPTYASRSPPPQDHNYSGYGTYHPSSNQDRGLGNYRSERGGREPQNWDPVQR